MVLYGRMYIDENIFCIRNTGSSLANYPEVNAGVGGDADLFTVGYFFIVKIPGVLKCESIRI